MSKMIRISTETDAKIERIQSSLDITKQDIVKKAIDNLDKELILLQTDQAFKRLKKDKKAWGQECAQRTELESLDDWAINE